LAAAVLYFLDAASRLAALRWIGGRGGTGQPPQQHGFLARQSV
jgi:hypothetical protein